MYPLIYGLLHEASLPTFATIPTCVIGGFLGQIFGRKMAMILVQPILLIGFICQAAAQDVEMLQFGRLLCGLASGLVSGPAAVSVRPGFLGLLL